MSEPAQRTRAERLAIAGVIAPVVRGQSEQAAARRIYRVDAEGKVVGVTTLAAVQNAVLLAHRLEFDVLDGVRPDTTFCEKCGLPIKPLRNSGKLPKRCRHGEGCAKHTKCAGADCSEVAPRKAMTPVAVRRRNGRPWMCIACFAKWRSESPEWREKNARARAEIRSRRRPR